MSDSISERILSGDMRAAGRLMRAVEDQTPRAFELLDELHSATGDAEVVGITGLPGSGKSTLINRLISALRNTGDSVGCIAVDPTSPFSGGALLGDRIRMQEHASDRGVFIRSVATRGALGGISQSTPAMIQILDAMGFDWILTETVGVGQTDVDIMHLSDTNIVLLVPGLGDDVQLSKAGLMESADIIAMNKADKEGAVQYRQQIKQLLRATDREDGWEIPCVETTATEDKGTGQLQEAILEHRRWRREHIDEASHKESFFFHFLRLVSRSDIDRRICQYLRSEKGQQSLEAVVKGQRPPYQTSRELLREVTHSGGNT